MKYKNLEIEIEKSLKEKIKTIPLIVGALRVLYKISTKYLQTISGKYQYLTTEHKMILSIPQLRKESEASASTSKGGRWA